MRLSHCTAFWISSFSSNPTLRASISACLDHDITIYALLSRSFSVALGPPYAQDAVRLRTSSQRTPALLTGI